MNILLYIVNIKELKLEKKDHESQVTSAEERLAKYNKYHAENIPRLKELKKSLKPYNEEDIADRLSKLKIAHGERNTVKSNLATIKLIVKNKLKDVGIIALMIAVVFFLIIVIPQLILSK